MNNKTMNISRNIDLNEFNALGSYIFTVSLNTCLNIPSDQSTNTIKSWRLEIFSNTADLTIRTQVLVIPQEGNEYARYERTVKNTVGGSNFGGGTISVQPWHKVYFQGDLINTNLEFDKSATYNIGSSSNTVNNLYMQNAVTVLSDENHKTQIQDIPDNVLEAWSKVNFQMYKLNSEVQEKGEIAQFHFGVIAQRIKEVFEHAGLNFNDYGLLTYEKWDAVQAVEYMPATYDKEGNQTSPEIKAVEGKEAGEIYMVRYDEYIILEMAYQRKRLANLEAKFKS